ncbi:hypothetical protein BKE38_28750 [Pseudoroseomonas deserti]|uniref:YcxB-like protein domain-containing protein n=1 Tax=Teichococcus deserti TaxID=1817963 RepID=A0A1V2GTS1_9PROT|nr:hypothetical protein [Pseudoroseomonas deserti]ONG43660.1 hypothetical protein BKE38_28750 [Pseudoroseomonas deserti]
MTRLSLDWKAADQAALIALDSARSQPVALPAAVSLLQGAWLAALAVASLRVVDGLLRHLGDKPSLWRAPEAFELWLAGGILGVAAVIALAQQAWPRAAMRRLLAPYAAEPARQPLFGPVALELAPDRLTCRGEGFCWSFDRDRLDSLEVLPALMILRFGPALQAIALPLPRRDLSEAQQAEIRAWASPPAA